MASKYHTIIVGCGIAGLAAAEALSQKDMKVLMLDENFHTGGQLFRESNASKGLQTLLEPNRFKQKGFLLKKKIQATHIERIHNCQVIGVFPDKKVVFLDSSKKIKQVQAQFIIFATGAREKYFPFKGWTLPGVMSCGAVQILIKDHGVLPPPDIILAGTTPLQFALATNIFQNSGKVTALLDYNNLAAKLNILPLLPHHWQKMAEGMAHMARLVLNRTLFQQGVCVVEARGNNCLETIVAGKIDSKGKLISGTEQSYPAKTLAVGFGFSANIELPVQAGCGLEYSRQKGGWVIQVDDTMETSLPGVYAAGEITGIAGAEKSFIEGQMAARAILKKCSRIEGQATRKSDRVLKEKRDRQMKYGAFLNQLCQVPTSSYNSIDDDTIICRCEEITMGEIRRSIHSGFHTAGALKKATRCSMGRCQGRICGPMIIDIITALTGQPPEQTGLPSFRAPVKTIPMNGFIE
jgi:thioredoxin reductase/bacterioferritin-associated ferredoxin